MRFRPYEPKDLSRCLEIYSLNEPNRFPPDVKDIYRQTLENGETYFLVGEKDGAVVCTGGIYRIIHNNAAILCFGLVHPDFHGRGFGTASLLARLSLLNRDWPYYDVLIFAVEKSIGFYKRMGFLDIADWKDKSGKAHPSARLSLTTREIKMCRNLLAANGIEVPQGVALPVRSLAISTMFMATTPTEKTARNPH